MTFEEAEREAKRLTEETGVEHVVRVRPVSLGLPCNDWNYQPWPVPVKCVGCED